MREQGFILNIVLFIVLAGLVSFSFFYISTFTSTPISPRIIYSNIITRLTPTPTPVIDKKWVLKSSQGKTIFKIGQNTDLDMVHYKDWFFFPETIISHRLGIPVLKSYNLESGAFETIFTDEFPGKGIRNINDVQVINNTLFFSTGGYLAGGGLYYLDLPAKEKPVLIIGGSNQRIEKIRDNYWVIGGEGDGCGGETNLSNFNPVTKKATAFKTFKFMCGEGTTYLGIDNKNRVIFSFSSKSDEKDIMGVFTKIEAVDSNNPGKITNLFNDAKILKEVKGIHYIQASNKLLLFGNKLFIFDISSQKLDTIDQIKGGFILKEQGDIVCIDNNQGNNIELNVSSNKITFNSAYCKSNTNFETNQNAKFWEKVKTLNLPLGYNFVLE